MTQQDSFAPGDALRNVEILYVDGEAHRRDTMRRLLLSLGARRVHVAETGNEALLIVRGNQPGLVLVENRMTPMSGAQLVRHIRATENYPKALVPILVLGEAVSPQEVNLALGAGANHFLVKPVSPAKLYERMQWALSDPRPFEAVNGHYVIKQPQRQVANPAPAQNPGPAA